MHQAIDQGDIRPWAMAQMQRGKFGNIDPPWIGNNQFNPTLEHSLAYACAEDRVLFGGI